MFDEMESFIHTKCKPVSLAIAVRAANRELISMHVASMPAKGLLAKISLKKYGPRKDNRPHALRQMMEDIKTAYPEAKKFVSDKKTDYPKLVRNYFPEAVHETTKGQRGCVVGQGELKALVFDPLFPLNHTCAMVRDNLKTMSRRTWCTAKRIDRMQDLVDLYCHFHNRFVVRKIRIPVVYGNPIM